VSGGAVGRLSLFSLSISPYLTAAILLQLVSIVVAPLRALPRQGERGRQRLRDWTLGLTIGLTAFQGFGIALGLESVNRLVIDPGWLFRLTTVVTLTGGTVFLVWLTSQITARGVGNGLALVLFVGIVLEVPVAIADTLDLARRGLLSGGFLLGMAAFVVALTAVVVVMEAAHSRIPVNFTPRTLGARLIGGRSDLVLKLNSAGVVPVLLAPWLMLLPLWLSGLGGDDAPGWWRAVALQLQPGRPLQLALYGFAIMVGAFFYTAFVVDPEQVAGDLKTRGGVIEGVEPGEATAAHVDEALSRTTTFGACYLALICLVPEILIVRTGVPFYFGGTSLLIVVCAMLDLRAQLSNTARV
jgi:preprotein translocase subunit SecY